MREDGNRDGIGGMTIETGNEELTLLLPELTPSTNYTFQIELMSQQFLLATETIDTVTSEFICNGKPTVVFLNSIAACHLYYITF